MKVGRFLAWTVALTLLFPLRAWALTAEEIVQRANLASYYAGDDGMARVKMELISRGGKKRYRELTILRKDIEDGGEQRFYVYFHRPSDVRRMVFMVWKHMEKDDDRWLYIPAIDLVKRIATRDKRSSFAGSDFTYEDVSGRHPDDDNHTLIGEERLDGKEVYVIKSVPKEPRLVEFSYYITWIDKETFIPLRAEYYNKRGRLQRVIRAEEIRVIQGFPTVVKARAENLETGHTTTVQFTKIRYNVGIEGTVFQERFLRRPPRRWIR